MNEDRRIKQINRPLSAIVCDNMYLLCSICAIIWVWILICMSGVALFGFKEIVFFLFFLTLLCPWFFLLSIFKKLKKRRAQILLICSIVATLIRVESLKYVFINGIIFLVYKEISNPKKSKIKKILQLKDKIGKKNG